MRKFEGQIYIIAGFCFLGISGTAMAGPSGTASIANCSGGGVVISATTINWLTTGSQPNTGCFSTGIATALSYSGGFVGAGATGNIKDLGAGGGSADQFLTILGMDFVLTSFSASSTTSTACDTTVGDSCIAFPGSPFVMTNTATGVSIQTGLVGTVTDAGVTSPWEAIFSLELPATTCAAIQTIIKGGGSISSSYSAALKVASTGGGPLTVNSVTPNTGTGQGPVVFDWSFTDTSGYSDVSYVYAMLSGTGSGVNSCFVVYYTPLNTLYLYNDAANALMGPITPGSSNTLSNNQCTLNGVGSGGSGSGNTLMFSADVTFAAGFTGTKTNYGLVASKSGQTSGFVAFGNWVP